MNIQWLRTRDISDIVNSSGNDELTIRFSRASCDPYRSSGTPAINNRLHSPIRGQNEYQKTCPMFVYSQTLCHSHSYVFVMCQERET